MKTLLINFYFCLLILISIIPFCLKAEPNETIPPPGPETATNNTIPEPIQVKRIKTPPFLDGIAVDECWQLTPATRIMVFNEKEHQQISLKACTNGRKIFFLIEYETVSEGRQHQSWHWDPVLQAYIPGEEKEEAFSIVLAGKPENNTEADVWIWRAARTDPVNKADDLYYFESTQIFQPKRSIIMDKGEHCWFSKYFGDYAGAELPRFYNRTPKGSVADVDAKGNWDKNHLKIEFARKLETRNKDDIALGIGRYYIQVYRGIPTTMTINNNLFIPLIIK